jgi:hypothetical protein
VPYHHEEARARTQAHGRPRGVDAEPGGGLVLPAPPPIFRRRQRPAQALRPIDANACSCKDRARCPSLFRDRDFREVRPSACGASFPDRSERSTEIALERSSSNALLWRGGNLDGLRRPGLPRRLRLAPLGPEQLGVRDVQPAVTARRAQEAEECVISDARSLGQSTQIPSGHRRVGIVDECPSRCGIFDTHQYAATASTSSGRVAAGSSCTSK